MEFPYFLLYSTPVDAYLTMDSMGPPYGVNRCLLFPTPAYPSSLWIQVKRVKPFRQRQHTCTSIRVDTSLLDRGEETGQKEEEFFFCVPRFFKGLLLFRMERHGETRPIGCSRQKKIRFFRSCHGMCDGSSLSFASFLERARCDYVS